MTSQTPRVVIQGENVRVIVDVIIIVVISAVKYCVWQAVRKAIDFHASSLTYSESARSHSVHIKAQVSDGDADFSNKVID